MPEHEVGLSHGDDVGARLPIGMRIDSGAHQCPDLDRLPANPACGVCDHAGRRDHLDRADLCLCWGRPKQTNRDREGCGEAQETTLRRGLEPFS